MLLLEDELVRLTLDPVKHLVTYTRTSTPFPSIARHDEMTRRLVAALAKIDRSRHVILVDLRQAPLRNDPEFEAAAVRFQNDVLRGFQRLAVLTRTHVGRLQVTRHGNEQGVQVKVFLDESDAKKHLGVA